MVKDYRHRLHIQCSEEQKNRVIQNVCRRDENEKFLFDFNLLIHQPTDLNVENYFDAECYCEYLAENRLEPDWDKAEITFEYYGFKHTLKHKEEAKKMYENGLKYGYLSWYDWRRSMWGTKWNAYNAQLEKYGLSYDTANGKALEPLVVLSAKFPSIQFYVEWANEDKGYNCGKATLYAGNIINLKEYDRRKDGYEALRFALDVWGYYSSDDSVGGTVLPDLETN